MKAFDENVWVQAEDETEVRRSQIAGFLYRGPHDEKAGPLAGSHVVRDRLREGDQVLWREHDKDGSRYDELHKKAWLIIRARQARIVYNRYMELMADRVAPTS